MAKTSDGFVVKLIFIVTIICVVGLGGWFSFAAVFYLFSPNIRFT